MRNPIPEDEYVTALLAEWDAREIALAGRDVRTIYVGGGTPSAVRIESMERIFERMEAYTPIEVTLEANPLDIDEEKLEGWRSCGVTRLSLGVQSFDDAYLKRLGRDHDGERAVRAVESAIAAGFAVNLDLIFAGPSHDSALLDRDVATALRLGPVHVSGYQLTVEPNTVFSRRASSGDLALPDEDDVALLFDRLGAQLEGAGLWRYEVSNYARRGFESVHNTGYWRGHEYLGVGLGAHSLEISEGVARRRANGRDLKSYIKSRGDTGEVEELGASVHLRERLFLALRTRLATDADELVAQFPGADRGVLASRLAELEDEGLATWVGSSFAATPRGLDLSNDVAEIVWGWEL